MPDATKKDSGWPERCQKASSAEMHLYSEEALDDLIETSLRLAKEKIADQMQSHHPDLHAQLEREALEEHEQRVGQIKLLFFQKRTGKPF